MGRRVWWTLVKRHHDVGTDAALDVHHPFRRKQVFAPVNVAPEGCAFFGDLPILSQTEHLVAPAVGQNGTVPIHELVQSTHFLQHLCAWPQMQVVGVAQNDVGVDDLFQFRLRDRAHRANGAHGHENGGLDVSMVGGEHACTGFGTGILGFEGELQRDNVDDSAQSGPCPWNPKGNFTT